VAEVGLRCNDWRTKCKMRFGDGRLSTRPGAPMFCPQCDRRRSSFCKRAWDAVNREAQIATVLIVGFASAFLGWAMVYLASAPNPYKGTRTGFRRRLASAAHRLLKARE
jgi:hypothetical protein